MKLNALKNVTQQIVGDVLKVFPEERISVQAVAHERVELFIDGVKYSGTELVNGKRITLKKEGKNLVFDVDVESFAQVENFYGTEGASLDGLGWQFSNAEYLKLANDGIVVLTKGAFGLQVGPLAVVGATGLGAAGLAAGALGLAALGGGGGGAGGAPASNEQAAAALAAFAQANTTGMTHATGAVPDLAAYTAAGVTGVTADNLAAINDALASAPVTGAKADTPAKLQAIVDAYKAIQLEANGTTPDATPTVNPTAAQYAVIGAEIGAASTDAENLALLNDIVGAKQFADVDTIAEINELARIANAIQTVAAGGTASPALTVDDLRLIGLNTTGLTSANLPTLLRAMAAKNDDGTQTDSLSELQAIIDGVDKVAPAAATLAETGTNLADGMLNNAEAATTTLRATLPTSGSTAVAGDKVELLLGGSAFGTPKTVTLSATDISNGYVDFTVRKDDLGVDGSKSLTTQITDVAGNLGTVSTPITFTLDTVAAGQPAAPTTYVDNVGALTNDSSAAATTDDTTPGIKVGTGLTTPKLYVDGVLVAATYDSVAGTLTPNAAITANGSHVFTYTVSEASGNESQPSAGLAITIDTVAPAAAALAENGSTDLADGKLNNAEAATTTFRATLPLSGSTAVAGDKIELLLGGNAFGTPKTVTLSATDITNGYVDFTVRKADLGADGSKSLTTQITDVAGNPGTVSTALTFTLDTSADVGANLAVTLGAAFTSTNNA